MLLPKHPAIIKALDDLDMLITQLGPAVKVSVDLSLVRSYRYHTGLVFTVHSPQTPELLCRGGRYDGIGEYFGRKRPATGFSMDLRTLCAVSPIEFNKHDGVYAPNIPEDSSLTTKIDALRAQGVRVINGFCQDGSDKHQHGCRQELMNVGGDWQVADIE
jgi:ATP phosphoribosyltransferase regulatory subunit